MSIFLEKLIVLSVLLIVSGINFRFLIKNISSNIKQFDLLFRII